ncbi:hypothetical protein GXM_01705 [Nostoc sphaeroides CCNUC1]|uniref:Uncharacterized protein n=1 Tax=Nostoc sphaeroides CCNUC1 TaxID=2653204 RepID=A0A5P8VUX4_9NOSO|nr:hypothetical protein GXM_01705 [Nostoc sphaeroides CCNUC1]
MVSQSVNLQADNYVLVLSRLQSATEAFADLFCLIHSNY